MEGGGWVWVWGIVDRYDEGAGEGEKGEEEMW